jgi:serine/threonine protein kinase
MPAPATIQEFLDVVRRSKQVNDERLEQYLQQRPEESLPPKPRKFAVEMIRDGLLTTFQAEQFLQGKYKGFSLGGYRILERLGAGGAGTVYLAEHEVMKRRVAIKVLPTPCAEDPALLERFRREARAAALLNHPNIVRVFDFRQEGLLHFIVMEYIEGPNLQQLVHRRGCLPIPVACEYIRQAALGLEHAHDIGLVHRDIKPANLLVDASGAIRVLDLGLARYEVADEESVTRMFNNQVVLGTADYLAPEQALDLHTVDGRADIYSLGATLYTLLAGRPPFDEGSVAQKLMWHQIKEPPPVTAFRPEVPPELAALVTSMLAKQPQDRMASMAEVSESLAPWANQALASMRPGPKTLIDLRNEQRVVSLALTSGLQNAPAVSAGNTWTSSAREDTAPMEPKRQAIVPPKPVTPPPLPPPGRRHGSHWWLAIAMGIIGLVVGLAGGITALLLWGLRG